MRTAIKKTPHQKKVERLIADLGARGVREGIAAPPIFRTLWSMGLEVPPPLFLGFLTLAVSMSVFATLFFGTWMALVVLLFMGSRLNLIFFLCCVGFGLLAGIGTAASWRWQASQLNLPSWNDY